MECSGRNVCFEGLLRFVFKRENLVPQAHQKLVKSKTYIHLHFSSAGLIERNSQSIVSAVVNQCTTSVSSDQFKHSNYRSMRCCCFDLRMTSSELSPLSYT